MDYSEIEEKSQKYLFQNYGRIPLAFERGEGMYLYDTEGKRYMDLVVLSVAFNMPCK